MAKTKLTRRNPPATDNVGRVNSTRYLLYDTMFMDLGLPETEKQFLIHLKKKTKSELSFYKVTAYKDLLGSELLRQMYQLNEPLSIVMTGHLFIESLLNKVIESKFKHSNLILDNREFTFNLKLETLKAKNYLDDHLYFDIKYLNSLRNKYAHNLLYDIADFDLSKFLYCDLAYKATKFNSKKARHELNIFILRRVIVDLLYRITSKYSHVGQIALTK